MEGAADSLLMDLNPDQRRAAEHGFDPLLIVAGAGTGKTTTLAHRVASLIANGVDPSRILLLTFTRRAAAEMIRRVDALMSRWRASGKATAIASSREVVGGTFHAVATRLLRQHGQLIGLGPEFSVIDRSDAEDLINLLRSELKLARTANRFPLKGTCLAIYSLCMNRLSSLEDVLQHNFPWCKEHDESLRELYKAYSDRKEAQQILDYDDLLLFWNALVHTQGAAEVVRARFDCVLVDEYQDTNSLQSSIVRGLSPQGKGLTVVGDDAQSIYAFRGATVRNILDFPNQFPGTCVLKIEQNYRSTPSVLAATNAVIGLASEGHRKTLWSARADGPKPVVVTCLDETVQCAYVIDKILSHREQGTILRKQAVLFRASHHSLALEVELARHNIPFHKFGGLKFVESAHVKDLVALLRLALNPRDSVSAMRILLLIPGIGPKSADNLVRILQQAEGDFEAWKAWTPPASATPHWQLLVSLLRLLAQKQSRPASEPVGKDVHLARTFYQPLLEAKYDDAFVRRRDLEQLEQMANQFESLGVFLTDMTLDPPSSTQDFAADPFLDEDWLTLSTIHSAKGLEWENVYVLHAADGNIPADMATGSPEEIEEERRLFYVAISRAKTNLYVMHPQRYYFRPRDASDRHSFSQRTRFLPEEIMGCFDTENATGKVAAGSAFPAVAVTTTDKIRSQIRKQWE